LVLEAAAHIGYAFIEGLLTPANVFDAHAVTTLYPGTNAGTTLLGQRQKIWTDAEALNEEEIRSLD
jgi:hypothetical protein